MRGPAFGECLWETKKSARSDGRRTKYPKHVHCNEDKGHISYHGDQSFPRLPPSDPEREIRLQGQLQNNDLFPFSLEERSDDEAFFAAFNDRGDEGAYLRRLDRDGFNEIMSCPSLASRKPHLPDETFEQRAKKRGRDSAALQLALRLFCGNHEQHYGSLADQRLVDFPPTLTSKFKEPKESKGRDAFQCTKRNARFRAEQFEYEKVEPNSRPTASEEQTKSGVQHPRIINPLAWSGVREANKEIEGILLQRLVWKILVMAARRINQGSYPQSLEEQFVQSQWGSIVACQTDELGHRSDIQDLVFEYITCLLGEEYQLGPNFTGRIYDYSVSPSSIRMLNSLASAEQPSSIQSSLRERALCPVAMRILYLFSETSDNKANEKQGTAMEPNETMTPPEERVEHFEEQRQFLRQITPRWKSEGRYLSLKDVVKPFRSGLSVSEATSDLNIMSAVLAVENTRDPKHYDLDYDQIWSFSRELPTYSKVRNFFSMKFYDGTLREDVIDPWEEGSEYNYEELADYTQSHNQMPGTSDKIEHRIPYIPPPKPQPLTQASLDGSAPNDPAPNDPAPEVGSGKIMPLPLVNFDPEKLKVEPVEKVKKWRIAKYFPGRLGNFSLPETGFIEAAMGAQIQKDLDEWECKNNNGEVRPRQVDGNVPASDKFKLPTPKPIWTVAPNYPIKVIPRTRGVGRGRQAVPLIPLRTQHSNGGTAASAQPAEAGEGEKRAASRKEYKRAIYPPTRTKRVEKRKPEFGEGNVPTSTAAAKTESATKPTEKKPTVSIKKRHERTLKDYKPLPPKQAAMLRKLRKREKRIQVLSAPKEKQREEVQSLEKSAPTKTKDDTQSSSPRSRIVGTGYHHLPASDKPVSFSSPTAQPTALTAQGVDNPKQPNPIHAELSAKAARGGSGQAKTLYPWLPSDRSSNLIPMKNLGVAFSERKTPWKKHPVMLKERKSNKGKDVEIQGR